MGHNLSPEIREELINCNNQESNKKCIITSLDNDFQFMLEGYTLQTKDINSDVKNLKSILPDSTCFILMNVNRFTPKYKWVLLLWHPDEKTKTEVQEALKKESTEVNTKHKNAKPANTCVAKLENKNKYENKVYDLTRVIYSSLKNCILDFLYNDNVPLIEITNFEGLEKHMYDMNKHVINDNFIDLKNKMKEKDFFQSTVKNYICENYILNVDARNSFFFKETKELNDNIELLRKDDFMSVNLFTFDIMDMTLISKHLKIRDIEEIQHFLADKNVFYSVYKISDTYTLFFCCSENCDKKEKFLYSLYKPKLIEFLKKKKVSIFLSVEINKLKYLIDFINLDMKKHYQIMRSKSSSKQTKQKSTSSSSSTPVTNDSKEESTLRHNSSKLKNEVVPKKACMNFILERSYTLKRKIFSSNKNNAFRRSDTVVNFRLPGSADSKKEPLYRTLRSEGGKNKKNHMTRTNASKNSNSKTYVDKKKMTKSDFIIGTKKNNINNKNVNIPPKKIISTNSEKSGQKFTRGKSVVIEKASFPKLLKKKSTTEQKTPFILNELKASYKAKKKINLMMGRSTELSKLKKFSNICTHSISSFSDVHSSSHQSKETSSQTLASGDSQHTTEKNYTYVTKNVERNDKPQKGKQINDKMNRTNATQNAEINETSKMSVKGKLKAEKSGDKQKKKKK